MTSAAISAVPLSATGMASAAISTARDFGMCIGPTIVSAVALGAAGSDLPHRLAGLDPGTAAAADHAASAGDPFAVLSIPGAAPAALRALSHGYSLGLVICGCAALVAALTTALWLRESTDRRPVPVPATTPA
jgi:hypothetical protein